MNITFAMRMCWLKCAHALASMDVGLRPFWLRAPQLCGERAVLRLGPAAVMRS